MKLRSYITQTSLYYDRITAPGTIGIIQANHSLANGWLSHSNSLMVLGILQNMVNPSLAPTQPEGSELPTFSYGGEGIPRVLKQYRFSPYGYNFPIRWSNQLNQSERLIYAPLAWITTDPGNGLVSSLCQAIAWTNFDLHLTARLRTNCSDFF